MSEIRNTGKAAAPPPPPPGIKLGDIYFVLFRHKWKILIFSILGLVAAGVLYMLNAPLFGSDARLLVRYVVESKSEAVGPDGQAKSPPSTGENIINSELEILTSMDICVQVAKAVGPEKILARAGGGSNLMAAANMISRGLTAEVSKKSNVIRVRLDHPDPELVQPALTQLLDSYAKRHAEIHRDLGAVDAFLAQQTDQLKGRLIESEVQLRTLKSRAGIISLEDSKKAYTEQMSKIRQDIFTAEAQLAEQQPLLLDAARRPPTNGEPATAAPAEPPLPTEKVNEYKTILSRLDSLREQEFGLRSQFTDENPRVKRIREQVAENEALKKKLEEQNPRLTAIPSPAKTTTSVLQPQPTDDPNRARALEAKIKVLIGQLEKVRAEVTNLDQLETEILQFQRKKELEERNYRYFAAGLEQARFEEALASSKLSNISIVQTPSAPSRTPGKRSKMCAMALAAGLFGGIALAFLLELVVDQTLKRPSEVESKLHLPLFFSIPKLALNGHSLHLLPAAAPGARGSDLASPSPPTLTPEPPSITQSAIRNPPSAIPIPAEDAATRPTSEVWSSGHPLRPFFEGVRDSTLMHFEGDKHRPKLIGITSCSRGAGVTTIAAGLAAALSETGDGNVLLADLNVDSQSTHPFFHGKPGCELIDALESEKRQSGLVLENLYMAAAHHGSGNGSSMLPKRLSNIVPDLKASDYDYIVFDLPLTTTTSLTPRLAGKLDMVLLVIESEKDSHETLKQAARLLTRSEGRVSAVLNKTKSYVPRWLHRDL
jgi:uncharacterized protein involved in exopolysaccharide biosynthesis/Mrp family chromosome partitioning ATPase